MSKSASTIKALPDDAIPYTAKSRVRVQDSKDSVVLEKEDMFFLNEANRKFYVYAAVGVKLKRFSVEPDLYFKLGKHIPSDPRRVARNKNENLAIYNSRIKMQNAARAATNAIQAQRDRMASVLSKAVLETQASIDRGGVSHEEQEQLIAFLNVLTLLAQKAKMKYGKDTTDIDSRIAQAEARLKRKGGSNPFKLV